MDSSSDNFCQFSHTEALEVLCSKNPQNPLHLTQSIGHFVRNGQVCKQKCLDFLTAKTAKLETPQQKQTSYL